MGFTKSSPSTSCRRSFTAATSASARACRRRRLAPQILEPDRPWQDEALSICLDKPNVYIDLSGWSPKYFPPQLLQYANSQLKTKMLFGSDFPLIQPDRRLKYFREAGFKPEVHDLILKQNAISALNIRLAA
jgi:uncharacterized protein